MWRAPEHDRESAGNVEDALSATHRGYTGVLALI